jgi:hypothetical protein
MGIRIRAPSTQSLVSRSSCPHEPVSYGSTHRHGLSFFLDVLTILTFSLQALKGTPACYIFSCPMENACPYHALVPYGPSREPGLILLSTRGEIRFWDSIGIGLAGGEHYSVTFLDLIGSEYISNFIRADVS